MATIFKFSTKVRNDAFFRQWNGCACCGRSLVNIVDHAHHVIPQQTGNKANPADAFLSSVDNCVLLCEDCHYRVHENGRYRTGAVAPASYYPFSHGKETLLHAEWAAMLERQWNRKFRRAT